MGGEKLGRLGHQLDFRDVADVNLGEVILVEITRHHLAIFDDVLLLQLLLGAKHIPSRVDLLVLSIDGLTLLFSGVGEIGGLRIEIVDGLVELGNVDVLAIQFLAKRLQLLVLLL